MIQKTNTAMEEAGRPAGLSGWETAALLPRMEKMYGDLKDAIRCIPPACQGMLTGSESSLVELILGDPEAEASGAREIQVAPQDGEPGQLRIEYDRVVFHYNREQDSLTYSNKMARVLGKIETFRQYRKAYYDIVALLREHIPKDTRGTFLLVDSSGGVPLVSLSLYFPPFEEKKSTVIVPCNATPVEMEAFYKRIKNAAQAVRAYARARNRKTSEIARCSDISGSILAADIIRHIQYRDKEDTIPSMVSAMRYGLASKDDPGHGQYGFLKTGEIESTIRQMASAGILRIRSAKGREKLKVKDRGFAELILSGQPRHYGEDREYEEYTDADWEAFFTGEDAEGIGEAEEWLPLTSVFQHKAFCCRKIKLVTAFFEKAPEEIREYIATLAELEEDEVVRKFMEQAVEETEEG